MSTSSNVNELICHIAEHANSVMMSSTIPIYVDSETELPIDFNRTGILLRIESEHFIITASHGISEYIAGGQMLYADYSTRTETPIPLYQCQFHGTEVDDSFPDRDIVAIHLDQDAVDQFHPQRKFLTLAEFDTFIDPRPALYMVAGYPWDTYQMIPEVKGMPTFFFGSVEPSPPTENFDARVHLALSMDAYGLRVTETGSVPDALPDFDGMSGCGIWRVASDRSKSVESWDSSQVRLVAIQNRTRSISHTMGTWVWYAVQRIVKALPRIEPAVVAATNNRSFHSL